MMTPTPSTSDEKLVALCLEGEAEAWDLLVERYGRFVYAILRRGGVLAADAPDVFQEVWIDLHHSLHTLNDSGSLRPWLGTVARRKCHRWRARQEKLTQRESLDADLEARHDEAASEDRLERSERDQLVRDCIRRLPARCAELVRMLFFSDPPLPYKQVASRLGIAVGSIGFIRRRCLDRLMVLIRESGL